MDRRGNKGSDDKEFDTLAYWLGRLEATDNPDHLAAWLARVEVLDQWKADLADRMAAERAVISLYVTYDTDHYEVWLGPDWLELPDSDLETFFTAEQAAFIRRRKGDLSPDHALEFGHPYTPQMSYRDIDRHQLQYIDLCYIGDEED